LLVPVGTMSAPYPRAAEPEDGRPTRDGGSCRGRKPTLVPRAAPAAAAVVLVRAGSDPDAPVGDPPPVPVREAPPERCPEGDDTTGRPEPPGARGVKDGAFGAPEGDGGAIAGEGGGGVVILGRPGTLGRPGSLGRLGGCTVTGDGGGGGGGLAFGVGGGGGGVALGGGGGGGGGLTLGGATVVVGRAGVVTVVVGTIGTLGVVTVMLGTDGVVTVGIGSWPSAPPASISADAKPTTANATTPTEPAARRPPFRSDRTLSL
jgi:hypothetical protein